MKKIIYLTVAGMNLGGAIAHAITGEPYSVLAGVLTQVALSMWFIFAAFNVVEV